MAKNKSNAEDDDYDDDEPVDDSLDDYEEIELKEIAALKPALNARRRHEQLKEERALERLLRNDFYDWDY
jgi:hypothetical protein